MIINKNLTYKCSRCGMGEIGSEVGILIYDGDEQILCGQCSKDKGLKYTTKQAGLISAKNRFSGKTKKEISEIMKNVRGRKLVTLISTEGKNKDEIKQQAKTAFKKFTS